MHGRVLRDRLGRRPPRHRPGRTGTGTCWPAAGSATTRPGSPRCWPCSPSTATAPDDPIPVAIETPRGLLTACLRATGRQVYPVNPMSVARYRDRHSVAGQQIRPWRRGRPGQRAAHRHARAPAAARRQRAGPGHRGAGPRPARRRLGPHHRAQQAPLPPARVLPRLPGRLRRARGGITRPEARAVLAAAPTPAAPRR